MRRQTCSKSELPEGGEEEVETQTRNPSLTQTETRDPSLTQTQTQTKLSGCRRKRRGLHRFQVAHERKTYRGYAFVSAHRV